MDDKLNELLQYLLDVKAEENQMFVAEIDNLLSAYIDSELAGENADLRYPTVKAHIEKDPNLAMRYQELKSLLAQAERGEMVEPPISPVFDFSYLQTAASRPWQLSEMGHLVVQLSERLIRRALEKLSTLPSQDLSTFNLAGQLRHSTEAIELITIDDVDDLDVTIMVEAQSETELCQMIVSVNIPSRGGWPNLADISVKVYEEGGLLHEQLTNAFGKAVFNDIGFSSLANLSFEIAP